MTTFHSSVVRASTASYKLVQSSSGSTFFDSWDFFTAADPTHGLVTFLSQSEAESAGLAYTTKNGTTVMKVDDETTLGDGEGRKSVRISSKEKVKIGSVVLLDVVNIPYGKGVWPAFWTGKWRLQSVAKVQCGELMNCFLFDRRQSVTIGRMVERLISLKVYTSESKSFHPHNRLCEANFAPSLRAVKGRTSTPFTPLPDVRSLPPCKPLLLSSRPSSLPPSLLHCFATGLTATRRSNSCDANVNYNSGCGVHDRSVRTFGKGFNRAGGGLYAMSWDESGISFWVMLVRLRFLCSHPLFHFTQS